MEMVRPIIKEEADKDNYFARIPDDLLFSILSRVEELKYLCQFSLVSKRFASAVYQIKTVSATIPSLEIPRTESVTSVDELFPKLRSLTSKKITRFIRSSSVQDLKFLLFLEKFRELKSISMEFTCAKSLCSSSLFNLKVKFTSSGIVVERLVMMAANSVCKESEEGYDEQQEDVGTHRRFSIPDTILPLGCCTQWLLVLSLLVKCQPSLESVTITNCTKQGKLVLREQLVAWRNNLFPEGLLDKLTPGAHRIGWVPSLHLPISGYRMRGVYFVIIRMGAPSRSDSSTEYGDAMTWEYAGQENLVDEAVREILNKIGNHRY